jgi:hypothetical protein
MSFHQCVDRCPHAGVVQREPLRPVEVAMLAGSTWRALQAGYAMLRQARRDLVARRLLRSRDIGTSIDVSGLSQGGPIGSCQKRAFADKTRRELFNDPALCDAAGRDACCCSG